MIRFGRRKHRHRETAAAAGDEEFVVTEFGRRRVRHGLLGKIMEWGAAMKAWIVRVLKHARPRHVNH